MSLHLVVHCEGTPADRPSIPLGECRSSFPTTSTTGGMAVAEAIEKGWSIAPGGRHLCPSCTGARARRAQ